MVYTAQDEEFAKPIFADFTKATGIAVLPKFDTESTKTAGLANAIVEEAERRPRCDVFWNNEILLTLRLARLGLLDVYRPKIAERYPEMYRSKDGLWHGLAARARILLVNTKRMPKEQWPQSITDLTDARWKGRIGMAKPLFGTTATHAACLFAAWGDEKAREFFDKLKANEVKILSGNKQVAQAVSSGEIDFGITDTDDAYEEIQAGRPVEIIYPDQGEGQIGTLYIPNTLGGDQRLAARGRSPPAGRLHPFAGGRGPAGPGPQRPGAAESGRDRPAADQDPADGPGDAGRFRKSGREVGRRGQVPPRAVRAVTLECGNLFPLSIWTCEAAVECVSTRERRNDTPLLSGFPVP